VQGHRIWRDRHSSTWHCEGNTILWTEGRRSEEEREEGERDEWKKEVGGKKGKREGRREGKREEGEREGGRKERGKEEGREGGSGSASSKVFAIDERHSGESDLEILLGGFIRGRTYPHHDRQLRVKTIHQCYPNRRRRSEKERKERGTASFLSYQGCCCTM